MPKQVLNIMEMLEDIKKTSRSIVVTAPTSFDVENTSLTVSVEVNKLPSGISNGDKCFIASNGHVVCWGTISDMKECISLKHDSDKTQPVFCIDIKPPFYQLNNRIPMKDFKGYRYFFYNE